VFARFENLFSGCLMAR